MLNAQSDIPDTVLEIIEAMTRFEAIDRPTAAEVRELAETAAALVGGESLARFARIEVPPMVEARSRSNANLPLPGTVTLSGASASTSSVRVETTQEPSMVTSTAPVPAPAARFRPALAGLVLATLLAGFATVVGLGALAWNTFGGLSGSGVAVDQAAVAEQIDPVVVAVVEPMAPEVVPPEAAVLMPVDVEPVGVEPVEQPVAPAVVDDAPERTRTPSESGSGAAPRQTAADKGKAAASIAACELDIDTGGIDDNVWVDGTWVGLSPITGMKFKAGQRNVEIKKEGKEKTEPYAVTIGPGVRTRIKYFPHDSKWRIIK